MAAERREAARAIDEELSTINRRAVLELQQQKLAGATGVVTMVNEEGSDEPRIVFEPAPLIVASINLAPLASSPATGPPPRKMYVPPLPQLHPNPYHCSAHMHRHVCVCLSGP